MMASVQVSLPDRPSSFSSSSSIERSKFITSEGPTDEAMAGQVSYPNRLALAWYDRARPDAFIAALPHGLLGRRRGQFPRAWHLAVLRNQYLSAALSRHRSLDKPGSFLSLGQRSHLPGVLPDTHFDPV